MLPSEKDFIVDYLRGTQRRFKTGADTGVLRIVRYGIENGYQLSEIAYNLATAGHETAQWYQPIREGCSRQGPAGTDREAVSAIQAAINRGIIKHNYLVITAGARHYGRGLVHITWLDNYRKYEELTALPLVSTPDLALEWPTALFIMYDGIHNGRFRGKRLSQFVQGSPTLASYTAARDCVNGDVRTNGLSIAREALVWLAYLQEHETALRAAYKPQSSIWLWFADLLKGILK